MMVQLENKLLDDLTKRDHDKLISKIELLKKANEELLIHNGALQFQVQNLSAEIENLKQRRVKAPNENMERKHWRHIVDGKPSKDITRSQCVCCKTKYVYDNQPFKITRHIEVLHEESTRFGGKFLRFEWKKGALTRTVVRRVAASNNSFFFTTLFVLINVYIFSFINIHT
jgi:hypothetical protein